MNILFLIIVAASCNSLALTMLKITGDQLRIHGEIFQALKTSWVLVLLGVLLYGVSFMLTIKIFSGSIFSRVVPMFIGINILSSLLIAIFYFKESISLSLLFGAGLIIAGVWFIQMSAA